MRKLSKYSETFGIIFGAAFLVSGANTLIAEHTDAPSIATYSIMHDLATRLIGGAESALMTAVIEEGGVQAIETDIAVAISVMDVKAGS